MAAVEVDGVNVGVGAAEAPSAAAVAAVAAVAAAEAAWRKEAPLVPGVAPPAPSPDPGGGDAAAGSDDGAVDEDDDLALVWAAHKGRVSAVDALLQKGYDLEVADEDGSTPLMAAAWANQPAMVKHLLERGAAVDSTNVHQWTALHAAAAKGHAECVRALLDGVTLASGVHVRANPSLVDIHNHQAYVYAHHHGHLDVEALIMEYVPRYAKEEEDKHWACSSCVIC